MASLRTLQLLCRTNIKLCSQGKLLKPLPWNLPHYCVRKLTSNYTNSSPSDEDSNVTSHLHGNTLHTPVMLEEVLEFLSPRENQVFLDMTFGAGGHGKAILDACSNTTLYAMDRDPVAVGIATQLANDHYGDRLVPLEGKFSDLQQLLLSRNVCYNSIDGVLIDAGCSSMQMDCAERGFSLSKEGTLDMRMDGNRNPQQPTAADVVNALSEIDISKILKIYGEEKQARKIAKAIVQYRETFQPIATTKELAHIVSCAFTHREAQKRRDKLSRPAHSATKTFQALRIFVNNELNELAMGLEQAEQFIKPGGKLAVITFHSLEDRIAKRFLRGIDYNEKHSMTFRDKRRLGMGREDEEDEPTVWRQIRKKVLIPTDEDVLKNPRARSAKLRTAVKINNDVDSGDN